MKEAWSVFTSHDEIKFDFHGIHFSDQASFAFFTESHMIFCPNQWTLMLRKELGTWSVFSENRG